MKREIENLLNEHLHNETKMFFLSGPRQVGKTTVAESLGTKNYYNWDNQQDRKNILLGPDHIAAMAGVARLDRGADGDRVCLD